MRQATRCGTVVVSGAIEGQGRAAPHWSEREVQTGEGRALRMSSVFSGCPLFAPRSKTIGAYPRANGKGFKCCSPDDPKLGERCRD